MSLVIVLLILMLMSHIIWEIKHSDPILLKLPANGSEKEAFSHLEIFRRKFRRDKSQSLKEHLKMTWQIQLGMKFGYRMAMMRARKMTTTSHQNQRKLRRGQIPAASNLSRHPTVPRSRKLPATARVCIFGRFWPGLRFSVLTGEKYPHSVLDE